MLIKESALGIICLTLFLSAVYLSITPESPKPLAFVNWMAFAVLVHSVVMGMP